MSIPCRGDLSPRRRYGYGRRRRRWPRVLLALVVLAAIGAGGYYGWHRWRDNGTTTAALAPCPASTVESSLPPPPPPTAPVRILNGSLKPGLAAQVGRQLHRRFEIPIGRVGNAARFVRGASIVRYPIRLGRDATQVAASVVPAARLVVDDSLHRVELDIGTRFQRVTTPAERQQRIEASIPGATATASASPSASPCPPS
jgi:hypothetical protein